VHPTSGTLICIPPTTSGSLICIPPTTRGTLLCFPPTSSGVQSKMKGKLSLGYKGIQPAMAAQPIGRSNNLKTNQGRRYCKMPTLQTREVELRTKMKGKKWASLRWISALVMRRIRNTSVFEIMSSCGARMFKPDLLFNALP